MKDSYESFDYFTGKIAPFLLFEMEYHSLFYVVENHKADKWYPEINPAAQVASIGLLAYFEAFCKHQFAAIINIFPSLIIDFAVKRGDPKIEITTVIAYGQNFEKNVGFLMAEAYDFGTAKAINGLFYDLLKISLFSNDEIKQMNEIVYQRNLLVHHGGYYTRQYINRKSPERKIFSKPFKDAVKINTEEYQEISDFLFEMAMKIARVTIKKIKTHSSFLAVAADDDRIKAIEEMLQGVNDTLDEGIDDV